MELYIILEKAVEKVTDNVIQPIQVLKFINKKISREVKRPGNGRVRTSCDKIWAKISPKDENMQIIKNRKVIAMAAMPPFYDIM